MYTNSSLANYKIISPNKNVGRLHSIDTVTIHCVVGQTSADSLGYFFQDPDLGASSNYGVGYDGKIGLYVEEKDRSWCTSSSANDNRAVTIEVASDMSEPYAITSAAYRSLVLLLTDICRRNNIKALKWSTSAYERMNHINGVNMTAHRDYANKSCPGTYIYEREAQIAAEVNKALGSSGVTVTVTPETGDSGVLKVQKWLNKEFRFGIEEDGICGYYTKQALVKGLQKILNPRPTITSVSKKSVPQASPKSNSELEIQGSKSKDDGFYYDEDEVFEQALWDDAYNAKFDELVKGESDEVNPDDLFGRTYNVMIYVAKTAQRVFPKEDVHRIRQSKNAFGRFLFLLKE